MKCNEIGIIVLDRKESDPPRTGSITRKYYLPTDQEFVLALAGDSIKIDSLFDALHIDSGATSSTVRKKLHDINSKTKHDGNNSDIVEGLLLVKDGTSFQLNDASFTNSRVTITANDPTYKCYGDGKDLAHYLISKFDFTSLLLSETCQHLIAIVEEISHVIDSVGSIEPFGIDVLVFTNDGRINHIPITQYSGNKKINCICETVRDLPDLSFLQPSLESRKTQTQTVPEKSIYALTILNKDYFIEYQIAGGEIRSIQPNTGANSLLISLSTVDDGDLTITLPRKLIDSTSYGDIRYIILCDGEETTCYETPTSVDRTLTVNFQKNCKEIEIIGTELHPTKTTASSDHVTEIYDAEKMHKLATDRKTPLAVETDKSVYAYGSDLIVTVTNPYLISNTPIILEIADNDKKIIHKNIISVSADAKGMYQEIIPIIGEDWSKPGSTYTIQAKYSEKTAKIKIHTSVSGTTLHLDQKVYSWRDKVSVTVVATDLVGDPKSIEEIGHTSNSKIVISTSQGRLDRYKLVETKKGTGIFTGEFQLSGFLNETIIKNGLDTPTTGTTLGYGPDDGKISCLNDDKIIVTLTTSTSVITVYALIRWNVGKISWLDHAWPASGTGTVRVIDPDMSLELEKINEFEIRVWGDTDPEGIKLTVSETRKNTGIFEGTVQFSTTKRMTRSQVLQVTKGDIVTAEYIDKTLPKPYSMQSGLTVGAAAQIEPPTPSLKRAKSSNLRVVDQSDKQLDYIQKGQDVFFSIDLTNLQGTKQRFAFIVEIEDEGGVRLDPIHTSNVLLENQTVTSKLMWRPDHAGRYTAVVLVRESVDSDVLLHPPRNLDIIVDDINSEHNDLRTHAVKERIRQRVPLKPVVSIPFGSGVPGCEKHHECYIPYRITIRVNQTVTWNNDDNVAHTIIDGTPSHESDDIFSSGLLVPGTSFTHKFTKKGTYPYYCIVHP